MPGSHRRQAAALVALLASSEAAGNMQGGSTDSQGAGHSHSGVSQRPGTDTRTNLGSAFIRRSAAPRTQTELARHAFLLQPHPSETLYLLTLDCARASSHSSVI